MASLSGTQRGHVIERYNENWGTRAIAEDLKLAVGTVSAVIHEHVQALRLARPSLNANGFAPLPASLVTSGNLDFLLPETISHSNTPPATTMTPPDSLLGGSSNEVQDQILHHYVRSRTPRQIMKLVNLGPGPVFEVINHARHAAGKSPIAYDVETTDQIADLFNAGWNPKDITQVLDLAEGGVADIIDGLTRQNAVSMLIPGPHVVVPGPNSNLVLVNELTWIHRPAHPVQRHFKPCPGFPGRLRSNHTGRDVLHRSQSHHLACFSWAQRTSLVNFWSRSIFKTIT